MITEMFTVGYIAQSVLCFGVMIVVGLGFLAIRGIVRIIANKVRG